MHHVGHGARKGRHKRKLDEDPEFNGQGGGVGIGDIIASLRALLSRGRDRRRGQPPPCAGRRQSCREPAVERERQEFRRVDQRQDRRARQVGADRQHGRQGLLETAGRAPVGDGRPCRGELTARLEELRKPTSKSRAEAERSGPSTILIDAQGRLISDDEMVKLNDQLSSPRAQTIELNARAASARAVKVKFVIGGALPEELTSPVMSELRSQYGAMKQQADQLSVRLGPRHPQYLAMQAQLEGAREQISRRAAAHRRLGAGRAQAARCSRSRIWPPGWPSSRSARPTSTAISSRCASWSARPPPSAASTRTICCVPRRRASRAASTPPISA